MNITVTLNVEPESDITEEFQKLLNLSNIGGTLTINFPVVTPQVGYYINTPVDVFSDTIIDFKGAYIKRSAQKTEHIMNVGYLYKHYGIPCTKGYGGGGRNVTIQNANFLGTEGNEFSTVIGVHHVTNFKLLNCTYNDALKESHSLDLLACDNVLVDNCTFTGFTPNPTRTFVECIQIDGSTAVGANSLVADKNTYDGLATKNVTVQNCKFLPLRNSAGKIIKPAPNPFGCHRYVQGFYYSGLRFLDNYVEDAVGTGLLKYSDNPKESIYNTGSWVRFYAVKADPNETNEDYIGVGVYVEGNTFKSTVKEDLTFAENSGKGIWSTENGCYMGSPKSPKYNTAVYIQCKDQGADPSQEGLEKGWEFDENGVQKISTTRCVPQPCADVQILNNKFIGFDSELSIRPIVAVSGIAGDRSEEPYYDDRYVKNVIINGNTFQNCFDYSKNDNNVSANCIQLSYVNGIEVSGNTFTNCRRAVSAANCKNLTIKDLTCSYVNYLPINVLNTDGLTINNVNIDRYSNGGIYTSNCKNGTITNCNIYKIGKASDSFTSYIAIKDGATITTSANTLTNDTTNTDKTHTYGIRSYCSNRATDNSIANFDTDISIK